MSLATLLGVLPGDWLTFGAGIIGALGVAAVLYGLFPAPYARLIQPAGALAIGVSCFLAGVGAERSAGEARGLKRELSEMREHLEFMDELAEAERVRATEEAALRQLTQGRLDALLDDDASDSQADIAAAASGAACPPPASRRLGDRARRLCALSGAACRD